MRLLSDATVEKDEVRWSRGTGQGEERWRGGELSPPWRGHELQGWARLPVFLPQSHAGKVVLRSWYEKNKHIFPASRWEPYDPEKKWDKYTVSGRPAGPGHCAG